MIIARRRLGGSGTQNAGLAFGGYTNSTQEATEEYDGSAWAASKIMITGRAYLGGAGTQAASIAFGGGDPNACSTTEEFTVTLGDCVLYNRDTCVRCVTGTCTQIS